MIKISDFFQKLSGEKELNVSIPTIKFILNHFIAHARAVRILIRLNQFAKPNMYNYFENFPSDYILELN